MTWEIFKKIKLGKLICEGVQDHSTIWFEFEKFKFFANTTKSKNLNLGYGIKFPCFENHGITEIKKLSPPQIIHNNNNQLKLKEDPKFVYNQFSRESNDDTLSSTNVLKYKLKMLKAFIELTNSSYTDSLLLYRDQTEFEKNFAFMHFSNKEFGPKNSFASNLHNADKFFESEDFSKFITIIASNKETIFNEIDDIFAAVDDEGIEGLITKNKIKDETLIELIRNKDYTL